MQQQKEDLKPYQPDFVLIASDDPNLNQKELYLPVALYTRSKILLLNIHNREIYFGYIELAIYEEQTHEITELIFISIPVFKFHGK